MPVLHHPDLGPAGIAFTQASLTAAPNYTANCPRAHRLRYLHSGDEISLNGHGASKQGYRITDFKIMPQRALIAWISSSAGAKNILILSTNYPFTHSGHTSILQYVIFAKPQ